MSRRGVSGWMFLLLSAHLGRPGQRAVKWSCVRVCVIDRLEIFALQENTDIFEHPSYHNRQEKDEKFLSLQSIGMAMAQWFKIIMVDSVDFGHERTVRLQQQQL